MNLDRVPLSARPFVARLAEFPPVEQIVLFGSRAVGDNDSRADIDLAVSAPSLDRWQFARLRVQAFEARTLHWISLVHLEETPGPLRERIYRQGKVLYERKATAR
ncbi:MAG: nucleotidyltransferase domain-containing protein [Planctomycetes bacterium]|nr:nucleotidyltransferase domain-containing protein [Planctomycetota bacterium]MBM4079211.1 nucleotidyltransferase domain-containing protein [Planctomycetota bacterium]